MTVGSVPETRPIGVVEVLNIWLDDSILSAIRNFVNSSLPSSDIVSTADILRFIEVELWLSFYSTTPTAFFDRENSELYPPAWTSMPRSQYMAILTAMGKSSGISEDTENQWEAPLSYDRELTHIAELIRRQCAGIGFVERETIASLDDDMLRLRSTLVDDIGLAHVRNPKKGYGPVQHGIVSLTTGIFLGGHIAARGESTIDIVKILQRSLCGASTESQIQLPGIVHALDRGYQSDVINQHVHSIGGKVVGTHKRTTKFPFTYGKPANRAQKAIELTGEKAAYWASKKLSNVNRASPIARAYALGYRSGLGSVTLCYTTDRTFGPGKWSYVCRQKDSPSTVTPAETFFLEFERGVRVLTETQRTADWFLLRKFRATGSVVSKIFHQIASATPDPRIFRDPVTDPDVQFAAMLLSMPLNSQPMAPLVAISSIDLESKTLEELKSLCRDRGLAVSGSKPVLKDRLKSFDGIDNGSRRASMKGEILSAWFMKPISSSAMKIGSHNEPQIAAHVKPFIAAHSHFKVDALNREMPFAAFSPDDIAVITSPTRPQFYAVLEYKTRVTEATQQREQLLAETHGIFSSVRLLENGNAPDFKSQIPDGSYRCQILHNIVCGQVSDGFLVFATQSRIIRVVHVFVEASVAATYRMAMKVICDAYMHWVYDESALTPYFSLDELGTRVDLHTLEQNLAMWRSLNRIIEERGRPLPAAKHIIPSLISLWNRVKGGIDVYSRYLKNVKSRHIALPPTAAIVLRICMTLVYNAYQSLQLVEVQSYQSTAQSFLKNIVSCTTYTSYQHYKQQLPSFASFCRDAAKSLATTAPPNCITNADNVEQEENDDEAQQRSQGIRYRKRVFFNSDPDLKRLRLSKRVQHEQVQ
ncbi:hypothetical protein PHMEG_0008312 [Phytophthora megakarya]|uniref:SAP domain-containing protein n=1 Tax=Phytophthora megakarya TaxID=4795 RepID=A0A225WJI0_9STRA|nr:hypothetical protein PHMEG_0008312 [Phytophthora megakarya]